VNALLRAAYLVTIGVAATLLHAILTPLLDPIPAAVIATAAALAGGYYGPRRPRSR
jgi:hypothetical protein